MDARLSYAVITPARNEAGHLARLAGCMLAQTHRPVCWVIVDDASDDATGELARDLERHHGWIQAMCTGGDGAELALGRLQGRDLEAFRLGLRHLPVKPDVFVKADADTSFSREYFEVLLSRFASDERLGIAGGACWEKRDGRWERTRVAGSHPRGASRAYRWALRSVVGALEPTMGWDGVDEVMAELRGYGTEGFTDFGFRHHRRVGERDGRLQAGAASGRQAWYMGYRPSYLLMRALYRSRADIAALAMVWGYAACALAGAPRCRLDGVVPHVRQRQRLLRVVRGGVVA
jgi:glycosyltransferase involved in cell wall biosynthesis